MVQLNLCFSFHKILFELVLGDPLAVNVDYCKAKVKNVGWITIELQFNIFSLALFIRVTVILKFFSL